MQERHTSVARVQAQRRAPAAQWPKNGRLGAQMREVCGAVWCSVVQCGAVSCRVLPCVAVCCCVLPCVAVCCSVLQCVAVCCIYVLHIGIGGLKFLT